MVYRRLFVFVNNKIKESAEIKCQKNENIEKKPTRAIVWHLSNWLDLQRDSLYKLQDSNLQFYGQLYKEAVWNKLRLLWFDYIWLKYPEYGPE